VSVRLDVCALDEVDALVGFLRQHWREDHVLVTDRRVLDWQHRDEEAGRYDFLLAWEGDDVVGVLGLIPTSRYDRDLVDGRDTLWLTTWRVRDDRASGLGLSLLRAATSRYRPTWTGTVGLRPATRPIYDALRYRTGVLERLCLLHPERDDLPLVDGAPRDRQRPWSHGVALELLTHDGFLEATRGLGIDEAATAPARSRRYVMARYLEHPFYRYEVHLARQGSAGPAALVVTRTCEHAGARALRVVDLIGDVGVLADAGAALAGLVVASEADYLDVYALDGADALRAAGLQRVSDTPALVLPGHFEPFERRNVELGWALHGPAGTGPTIIGKGDADQDRPSRPVTEVLR
jgi:hypothetical protein